MDEFVKPVLRISDGFGVYLDKKILKHLNVAKGDLVKITLNQNNEITIKRQEKLLDEETINDLLVRIDLDDNRINV